MRGPISQVKIPPLEHQSWEEEPTQYLAVKISRDSTTLVRKGTALLKDSAQSLSNGTHPGLKQRDGSLEWIAVIKGDIEYVATEGGLG